MEGKYFRVASLERGWTQFPNVIFQDKRLTANDRMVLLVFYKFADNITGECWPSHDTIAEMSGLSCSTIKRCVAKLEKLGYLSHTKRVNKHGQTTNLYCVTRLDKWDIPSEAHSDLPSEAHSDLPSEAHSDLPSEAHSDLPGSLTVSYRTIPNINYTQKVELDPDIKPSNRENIVFCSSEKNNLENIEYYCPTEREKQKRARLDEFSGEFEKIWALYPRHEGKKVACNSYCKQRSEGTATFEDVKKAVENYARRCREEGTQHKFIKMGSTFFGPNMYWQDFVNPDSSVSGGMMEPTSTDEFAEQRRCVREDFGGDFTAYQRWIIDGKPYSISPREWLEQRAERKRAGGTEQPQGGWNTPTGRIDPFGDETF